MELEIQVHWARFDLQGHVFAFKNALVRCLGSIIPFDSAIANTFFSDPFERWLKEVDVEPPIIINTIKESKLLLCFPAVIANGVTDNGPILSLAPPARAGVFHMRLIVLLVWARTCKGDLLVQAVAVQQIVDKFTAIIRINPKQWKGQSLTHQVDCFRNYFLGAVR